MVSFSFFGAFSGIGFIAFDSVCWILCSFIAYVQLHGVPINKGVYCSTNPTSISTQSYFPYTSVCFYTLFLKKTFDWLFDCLFDSFIDCLVGWLIAWSVDWLIDSGLIGIFFIYFFSVRLLSVLRGHRFFHPRHNGQWPPNSKDFYTRSYPLHYFLILILEIEPVFPFLMFSAKQGNYWYHFYNVFGLTRSLAGDWNRDLPHSMPALNQ